MKFERIHIIGPAGCGKTTLAQAFAQTNFAANIELDHIYYTDIARRERRESNQRHTLLTEAIRSERWVCEGIFWHAWIDQVMQQADQIVLLNLPRRTLHYRVITRHFRYLSQAKLADLPTFFPTLIELCRHNHRYKYTFLPETMARLTPYEEKLAICETTEDAMKLMGLGRC